MCEEVGGVRFAVVKEADPVVGSDVVRDDGVGVAIWTFVGFVWLFELSGVCGGVSVLVG